MKLLKFIIFCFLINTILFIQCYTQSSVSVPILIEPPDAVGSGMGCIGTASTNNINGSYWNPAGLGFLQKTLIPDGLFTDDFDNDTSFYFEVSTSTKFLPLFNNNDISFWNITFGTYIESFGTISFDYSNTGYGEMIHIHEQGNELGKFIINDSYLGLTFGFLVSDDWALGINAKYIKSKFEILPLLLKYIYDSYAFDIGVMWKPEKINVLGLDLGNALALGVTLKNLGPKMDFRNESEPLPTQFRFGTCMDLSRYGIENLRIAFDISKLLIYNNAKYIVNGNDTIAYKIESDPLPKSLITGWKNPGIEFGIGAEYWYKNYFALRAGYNTEPFYLGNRSSLTFGGSVRIHIVRADVSYNNSSGYSKYLTNVFKVTLRIGGNFN